MQRFRIPRRSGAVLSRNRHFLTLWVGESFAEAGQEMSKIALPLLVLALTGSAAKAGLIGVVRGVVMAIAVIPAGVISDRVDQRRLMIACALLRILALSSLPVALATSRPAFGLLLLVATVDAATASVSYVAERTLLPVLVESSELPEAITVNEARAASATIAGPPAGGALFGLARGAPFLGAVGAAVAELGALLSIGAPTDGYQTDGSPAEENPALRPARERVHREVWQGFTWLFSQPFLRAGSLLYATENVTLTAVQLLALLILHRHGASSAGIGLAYALVGAGGLLSAAIANPLRRRLPTRTAILLEPWAYVIALPLLLLVSSPLAVGVVVAVMFLPMTLSSSIIVGTRLQLAPDHLRGRIQASGAFVAVSLTWLGPLAVGLLVQYAGDDAATLALTAWAVLTALAASASRGFRAGPPEIG